MSRPTKVGRRADADERARAQAIVDDYYRLRDNPEAAPEWQRDMRDHLLSPRYLLQRLEGFAINGTFAGTQDMRPHLAAWIAERCGSAKFEDKVQAVMTELSVSERTAARLLSK